MNVRLTRRFLISFIPLLLTMPSPALSSGGGNRIILSVEGMHCQSCVSMIRKTVKKLPGVDSVAVNLEKGQVEVAPDSAGVRRDQIVEAIEKMGYDVLPPDSVAIPDAAGQGEENHGD